MLLIIISYDEVIDDDDGYDDDDDDDQQDGRSRAGRGEDAPVATTAVVTAEGSSFLADKARCQPFTFPVSSQSQLLLRLILTGILLLHTSFFCTH